LPRIVEAVRNLPVNNALIDGEAMVFRLDGHSDFVALRTKAGGELACLVAFDLLSLECDDLRQQPLTDRREALEQLVAGVDRSSSAKPSRATARLCSPTRASWAWRELYRSAS
jgi:ATP-dependent DNA ligase